MSQIITSLKPLSQIRTHVLTEIKHCNPGSSLFAPEIIRVFPFLFSPITSLNEDRGLYGFKILMSILFEPWMRLGVREYVEEANKATIRIHEYLHISKIVGFVSKLEFAGGEAVRGAQTNQGKLQERSSCRLSRRSAPCNFSCKHSASIIFQSVGELSWVPVIVRKLVFKNAQASQMKN
ncbi:hypothetical protein C5167_021664 [Papaver somniferum]|nr:hypothetical protein C5167_021664 [Papaver somniferum]